MQQSPLSLRPFIGAADFALSRRLYRELGFKETVLEPGFSLFSSGHTAFYLQDAYVKDWLNNTQLFVEVEDADQYWNQLVVLQLPARYPGVRLEPVRSLPWGKECFLHDPSGILWHYGHFNR